MIRVPRREDVPEFSDLPEAAAKVHAKVGDIFSQYPLSTAVTLAPIDFPEQLDEECLGCDGRGFEHDCPSCTCTCDRCDGSGKEDPDKDVSVDIGGVPFAARYVRLIQALPGIEVSATIDGNIPMPFRFNGGEGLLMALREPHVSHIKAKS
jgi:hypothetical protein